MSIASGRALTTERIREIPRPVNEPGRPGTRTGSMSDIVITRPHDLGLDGARHAAEEVAERLRQDFGVTVRNDGDSIHIEGRGVRGRLDAGPHEVRIEASLGLAARPFKRLLRREIESELDRLAPAP